MSARAALAVANAALALALAIKAHVPGDHAEDHEDNTFDLPDGAPIRRKMRSFFREQLKQVVGSIPTIGDPLHATLPRMSAWDDPMEAGMTPIIGIYWDKAGKSLRERIGLDPGGWRVTDPNVHAALKESSLKLCRSTNATTDLGLAQAQATLRDQLARGLVGRGDAVEQLTARVKAVFSRASDSRARTIAVTEASRAVHAASILSARQSGVVGGKRWLLSANSCPVCVAIARAAGLMPLDGSFGTVGHDPDYSTVRYPPAHPRCRCSLVFELSEEPPHAEEKKAEREDRRGEGGGGSARPDRPSGPSTHRPRHVPSPGRQVAAFVARNAVRAGVGAAVARPAARRVGEIVRRARERAESRSGGGLQPRIPPPGPALTRVPDRPGAIPPGPIGDRIRAYLEGQGKAKLERLANLDVAYQADRKAVDDAHAEALRELDKLRKRKGYTHEDTKAADARVRELADRRDSYRDSLRRNAARVAEAIAVPAASRALLATRMVTAGRAVPLVTREAEGWLGQVLAADEANPAGLKVEYGALKRADERAYYGDKDRRVNLSGAEPAPTIVHELGHAIEHQWPDVAARSYEFLDHRVGDEKVRQLRSIFPKRGYHASERGRKDRFGLAFDRDAADPWYCGKEYRRNPRKKETRYGSEILAMGLEKLMTDPVTFAREDPEFCGYILGILDGSLR